MTSRSTSRPIAFAAVIAGLLAACGGTPPESKDASAAPAASGEDEVVARGAFDDYDGDAGTPPPPPTEAEAEAARQSYSPYAGQRYPTRVYQEVHAFIRSRIAEAHGWAVAEVLRVLYGGSVKPDNVKGLMALPDVDGALVGGASLKADSFLKLVFYDKQ